MGTSLKEQSGMIEFINFYYMVQFGIYPPNTEILLELNSKNLLVTSNSFRIENSFDRLRGNMKITTVIELTLFLLNHFYPNFLLCCVVLRGIDLSKLISEKLTFFKTVNSFLLGEPYIITT
jgi:predicted membrane protein